jgi:glutamate racemase
MHSSRLHYNIIMMDNPLDSLLTNMKNNNSAPVPIGIFDSGVGGLSVLRHIHKQLPAHSIYYMADQLHVPYGPRSLEEVRAFSIAITRFLLEKGARVIVVACNTASAAALHTLREKFPSVPFVGMEPAVKPAANHTASGVVGVLATPATFQGELFASVVERFAQGIKIMKSTCPGLVEEIEAGRVKGVHAQEILHQALEPMLQQKVDTIVLGCTHYPFALEQIKEIVGPDVEVIDPSPAIARQTERMITQMGWQGQQNHPAVVTIYTSGSISALQQLLPNLLSENFPVKQVNWVENSVIDQKSTEL